MGLRVSTASAFDMLETLSDAGGRSRFTRMRFGEMARQVSEGAALTFRDAGDGALVCVVGLWPEDDHAEAWLAGGPALRAHLRSALDRAAEALETVAGAAGPLEVRAYVRASLSDRVAGARMASWLGFDRIGEEATRLGPVAVFSRAFPGGSDHGQHDKALLRPPLERGKARPGRGRNRPETQRA